MCASANGPAHGGTVRPASIVLACADANYWIDGLRWRGWGSATARASGRIHFNDCNPNCAAGHFYTLAGAAVLTQIRPGSRFGGVAAPFYTRLRLVPAASGKNRALRVDLSLPAHC